MYKEEQQRRCSIFLQAAQRGHVGRREFYRALWAKRSKDAAVVLSKAAIAKLEIIAARAVRSVIWRMKFSKAVLRLQSCCRGWRARNSNEYSRRRRIKSKIIRRLQNDSAITKLQRKIRAFKVQKAIALGLDMPETSPPPPPPPPDPESLPFAPPSASSVPLLRRMWPRLPSSLPLTPEQKAHRQLEAASVERLRLEDMAAVSRPADSKFAAAVLLQLQRSLFPRHVEALSPLPEEESSRYLAAAAAAFEDLKMSSPYGPFTEETSLRELKFWREKEEVVEARLAEEETRLFGEPFPNLAPNDDNVENSGGANPAQNELAAQIRTTHAPGGVDRHRVKQQQRYIVPQVPEHLQPPPPSSPGAATATSAAAPSSISATLIYPPITKRPPTAGELLYVSTDTRESDAPEARDLPITWFWLHPIASADTRVLDVFVPMMHEDDSAALKDVMQRRQWLPAARVMRAALSRLLLDEAPADEPRSSSRSAAAASLLSSRSMKAVDSAINAALALFIFMITASHSIIALAVGAEDQCQSLLLKIPPPPPPSASFAAKLMGDSATILGMARALLCSHPLDSCRLYPKLQCWLGAVEACLLYHGQRNTAAAEALVQALVWESKYKIGGDRATNTVWNSTSTDNPVVSEMRSSSLYLRSSVTLQLSCVCLRCGDAVQAEQLALQVLDSVSLFEVKKRDEHWSVMGASAEILLARLCAALDDRAMEAQQWVRKAMRSADRVAGPGRKSATRKPEALQVKLVVFLFLQQCLS
jgi:hypothetical protein